MSEHEEETEEEGVVDEGNDTILDMSDEDFLKMGEPVIEEKVIDDSAGTDDTNTGAEPTSEGKIIEEETTDDEVLKKTDGTNAKEPATEEVTDTKNLETAEKKSDTVDKSEVKEEVSAVNYEEEYKKVFAPFKANGVEIQAKNAEDAITLMQMGANYHKKMAALKPSLKTLKLLENNNLLDNDKINYLIDLHNKNPEAITKLLKDSNIDPLDINVKDDSSYKPLNRTVSDKEFALTEVLESIESTPSYTKTLNVITDQWDNASRSIIAEHPQIIQTINEQMENGVYDIVAKEVAYQRSVGKLIGLSDIEAYKVTGDELDKKGFFTKQTETKTEPLVKPIDKQTVTPKDPVQELERKERKKAASPTRNLGNQAKPSFNPLEMSDEEFEKFDKKLGHVV